MLFGIDQTGAREPRSRLRGIASAALLAAAVLAAPAQADDGSGLEGEIVAAVPADFAPLFMRGAIGELTGFGVDAMGEIAALAGLRVRYLVEESWLAADAVLQEGRANLIPVSGIRPPFTERYDYTSSILTYPIVIFVRSEAKGIESSADLAGRHVGATLHGAAARLLNQRTDVSLALRPDIRESIFDLFAGRVDAIAHAKPIVVIALREIDAEDRVRIVGRPLAEVKMGIAVRRGQPELLARLDDAVERFVGSPATERPSSNGTAAP